MKFKCIILALYLCLYSASILSAEYYFYTDKKGIKHYTDNLADVPADQRENLDVFQTQKSSRAKMPAPSEKTESLSLEALLQKKQDLEKQFQDLMKKKEALFEQKSVLDVKEYNTQAQALNLEIQDYQSKKEAFDRLVEQYNNTAGETGQESDAPKETQ